MNQGVETYNPFMELFLPIILIILAIFAVVFVIYFLRKRFIKKNRLEQAQDLVMLQVLIPKETKRKEDQQIKEDFREVISITEQLFSVVASHFQKGLFWRFFGQLRFSFEIVAKNNEILFYVGVPKNLKSFFEKQINGLYPAASVEENKDFKIFAPDMQTACGGLNLSRNYVYPIKTYKNLESDPLNGITNALSKLSHNERATIQILVRPNSGNWRFNTSRTAREIQEGKFSSDGGAGHFIGSFFNLIFDSLHGKSSQEMGKSENIRLTPHQEELLKALQAKSSKVGLDAQIRAVVVAPEEQDAKIHLQNIMHSFSQFTAPEWNGFDEIKIYSRKQFLISFILREFTKPYSILNTEELATIFHFPNQFTETPNIKWLMSKFMAPPTNLPLEGTVLGESVYRGESKLVRIKNEDRRRHLFMIGKTGVGKTTLFENMIQQDIEEGKGVCFIDPLGDAIEHILHYIPKERAEDVILFDPSDTQRPMGLNLLEWEKPEERDFLVAEWLEIFYKLFDPQKTGIVGPQFEHWGRNASLTVMSQPDGGTLIEIPRLFTDDAFREKVVPYVTDPVVESFWSQQLAKTADFHKSEMYNYFTSKFGRFMTNDLIRNIIGQKKSAFNLREIMDQGKILLVNLSKGKIGEMNSYLLGMVLISKIQIAAFSRADIPEDQRKDFYLYVDEFQNFTTDTFKTILSEARKYHLSLNITNQYIAQLTEPVRDAVIGNAGSLIVYRIGAADAEFMAKEFPGISESDMVNLDKYTTYIKLLIDLTPSRPFSMRGIKPEPKKGQDIAEAVRQLSRLKYGRDRLEVEEEIRNSWKPEETTDNFSEMPQREKQI